MSVVDLLRRINRPSSTPADETRSSFPPLAWDSYFRQVLGMHRDGSTVEAALKNAASWACIDVIADAYSRTPWDAVRKVGGQRQPLDPAPVIVSDPSGIVSPDVWLTQVATSILTDGNAFGQIVAYDPSGYPTQIEMLDPGTVKDRRVVDGVPTVHVNDRAEELYPTGRIWHVPGRIVLAGSPFGLSPITYASRTIGTTLAVEDFSNRFFTDGAHPTVVAMMDEDPGPEGAVAIKQKIVDATRGNREPLVFGGGKLDRLQVPPGETQFLDLARFCIEQACRFWRVPPGMVYLAMSGQNITYANVTQNDLQLLKYTLEGYYRRLEGAWSRTLPAAVVVKANRDGVLAADPKTRHEVHKLRLDAKTITVNEVRALEDEDPFDDPECNKPGIPDSARSRDLAETIQKVYLGVGKMITADEAREIANAAGADLPIPGPPMPAA